MISPSDKLRVKVRLDASWPAPKLRLEAAPEGLEMVSPMEDTPSLEGLLRWLEAAGLEVTHMHLAKRRARVNAIGPWQAD